MKLDNIKKIKKWARQKIKGNTRDILKAYLITNIILIAPLVIRPKTNYQEFIIQIVISIVYCLFTVGYTRYLINFTKDKKHSLTQLFSKFKNSKQILITYLYKLKNVFLWSLLLIVPGIIKSYAYSMIPYILAENEDIKPKDAVKLSEDMMNGHKIELLFLQISFIGWHLLSVYTLFLLELWIIPYQKTATTKFLNDIKEKYEKINIKKDS